VIAGSFVATLASCIWFIILESLSAWMEKLQMFRQRTDVPTCADVVQFLHSWFLVLGFGSFVFFRPPPLIGGDWIVRCFGALLLLKLVGQICPATAPTTGT
jgi:hypothetical protein